MALHHSLRDLVAVRGATVVEEAEEFRGVLDDFLAEDEATLGELNLLVDAVRLGALRRVLDVMANGAAPQAAVREAGAALARDRGTDDPTRSCWALASLCFALGKADESMVGTFLGETGTMSASRPVPPNAPAPDPVATGPTTAERPMTEVLPDGSAAPSAPAAGSTPGPSSAPPTATPTPTPFGGGPVPPVIPEQRSSRAGVYLLVVLVALLLGGLVATGVILLRSNGDDDPTTSDTPANDRTGGQGEAEALVSDNEMLVPYRTGEDDDAISMVYAVDINGSARPITDGPLDALPTLSPDRRTMTYGAGPAPFVQTRLDLETDVSEPFFPDTGPCAHALRPGWSLDGDQIALVCTGDDELAEGIYVAGADGSDPRLVVDDPLVAGSPTWISDTEFIFGIKSSADPDEAVLTFRRGFADGRPSEPFDVDVDVDDAQLTHIDWSPEAGKLLFLVSPFGGEEIGSVWTVNADGTGAEPLAEGFYSHPVWSPDGSSIGVTVVEGGTESLAYIPLDDPENPVVVPDPPPGEVGVPVWGTR